MLSKELSGKYAQIVMILLVGVIAFLPAVTILNAQFRGEDEVLTFRVVSNLLKSVQKLDVKGFVIKLLRDYHPPARNIVALPFVALLGANELALRFPNVLLWVAACMMAAHVGWRLGGIRTGFFSGAGLAVSGLFDLEAMGLGHAGETFWVLVVIALLLRAPDWTLQTIESRKTYILGGLACFLGFLWFTSLLPVCVMYHGMYAYSVLHGRKSWRHLRSYLLFTLPFIGLYLVYYAVFLGWPAYLVSTGQRAIPFGQTASNAIASRNESSQQPFSVPQFTSLKLVCAAIRFMACVSSRNALSTNISFGKFSCYWSGMGCYGHFTFPVTPPQHFFAYFCWVFPFGIAAFDRLLAHWNTRISVPVFLLVLLITGIWNYYTHVKTYTYATYPNALVSRVRGATLWRNNVVRPMEPMAQDLQRLLQPNERFIVLADGAFPLYYFDDERYLQKVSLAQLDEIPDGNSLSAQAGHCLSVPKTLRQQYPIRAAVAFTHQNFLRSWRGKSA